MSQFLASRIQNKGSLKSQEKRLLTLLCHVWGRDGIKINNARHFFLRASPYKGLFRCPAQRMLIIFL